MSAVQFERSASGLDRVQIKSSHCSGEVYLYGAHITVFQPAGQEPVLWVSKKSSFAEGKAIRGGVPICFPWFGPLASDPTAPSHGFARTKAWELVSANRDDDDDQVHVELQTEIEQFQLQYIATFGAELSIKLVVTLSEDAEQSATFEQALHSYFRVGDVRRVSIQGLESASYIDKVDGAAMKPPTGQSCQFTGETDRVYLDTTEPCVLHDPALKRTIHVAKSGSRSTVVWNPWIAKSAKMSDFGDDEWPEMVCIETANVGSNAITLRPGQVHTMSATISVT